MKTIMTCHPSHIEINGETINANQIKHIANTRVYTKRHNKDEHRLYVDVVLTTGETYSYDLTEDEEVLHTGGGDENYPMKWQTVVIDTVEGRSAVNSW